MKRPRLARRFAWSAPMAALLSLVLLSAAWLWAGNWYRESLIHDARAGVAAQIAARASALTSAVNQRIALLHGIYAYTRTAWPGTDFDYPFEVFSSGLYFDSTGLRTVMIAPEGIARYVYPIFDRQTLRGYDIMNDPDPAVRSDIQRAMHTRKIALSEPGPLRQGGFGITAWRAVYRGQEFWGLVSVALDMDAILADAGLSNSAGDVDLALRSGSGLPFFGRVQAWKDDPVVQKIEMPEGAWELGGVPYGGWYAAVSGPLRVFRLTSMAIVLLIAGIVYLVVNHNAALLEHAGELAALRERQRLARELHDSVSQVLYSIGLGARTARANLERDPARVREPLEYVNRLAETGQAEMRALLFELRPESLRLEGLKAALTKQADVLRARYELDVETELCEEPPVPLDTKEALYRIGQEAMHNIVKHARATHVCLLLEQANGRIHLSIRDDGAGFDPSLPSPGHLGLLSMRERAALHGGSVVIDSAPGRGTRIDVVMPAPPAQSRKTGPVDSPPVRG